MTRLIIMLLIISTGQAISQPKKTIHKFRIYTIDGGKIAGYLRDINDSVIVVSPQPLYYSKIQPVPYTKITSIKIRERQALWKRPIMGAVTGAALGAIIGYATYGGESYSYIIGTERGTEIPTIVGAIIGGWTGGLIGLVAVRLKRN